MASPIKYNTEPLPEGVVWDEEPQEATPLPQPSAQRYQTAPIPEGVVWDEEPKAVEEGDDWFTKDTFGDVGRAVQRMPSQFMGGLERAGGGLLALGSEIAAGQERLAATEEKPEHRDAPIWKQIKKDLADTSKGMRVAANDRDMLNEKELPLKSKFGQLTGDVGHSLTAMAPAFLAGILTGGNAGVTAYVMGNQTGFDAYSRALDAGRPQEDAMAEGVLSGSAEAIFEAIPAGMIFDWFKGGKRGFQKHLKELARYYGTELLTEELTTPTQNAAEIFYRQDDKVKAAEDVKTYLWGLFSGETVEVNGQVYDAREDFIHTALVTTLQASIMGMAGKGMAGVKNKVIKPKTPPEDQDLLNPTQEPPVPENVAQPAVPEASGPVEEPVTPQETAEPVETQPVEPETPITNAEFQRAQEILTAMEEGTATEQDEAELDGIFGTTQLPGVDPVQSYRNRLEQIRAQMQPQQQTLIDESQQPVVETVAPEPAPAEPVAAPVTPQVTPNNQEVFDDLRQLGWQYAMDSSETTSFEDAVKRNLINEDHPVHGLEGKDLLEAKRVWNQGVNSAMDSYIENAREDHASGRLTDQELQDRIDTYENEKIGTPKKTAAKLAEAEKQEKEGRALVKKAADQIYGEKAEPVVEEEKKQYATHDGQTYEVFGSADNPQFRYTSGPKAGKLVRNNKGNNMLLTTLKTAHHDKIRGAKSKLAFTDKAPVEEKPAAKPETPAKKTAETPAVDEELDVITKTKVEDTVRKMNDPDKAADFYRKHEDQRVRDYAKQFIDEYYFGEDSDGWSVDESGKKSDVKKTKKQDGAKRLQRILAANKNFKEKASAIKAISEIVQVEPPTKEATWLAEAIKNLFGVDVVYVKGMKVKALGTIGGVSSQRAIGTIFVEARDGASTMRVIGHELFHELAKRDKVLFKHFKKLLLYQMKNLPGWSQKLENLYKEKGLKSLSMEKATEELLADFLGDSLLDKNFLKKLEKAAPKNQKANVRKIAKSIKDILQSIIDQIKRTGGYVKEIETAHDILAEYLSVLSEGAGIEIEQTKRILESTEGVEQYSVETANTVDEERDRIAKAFDRPDTPHLDIINGLGLTTRGGKIVGAPDHMQNNRQIARVITEMQKWIESNQFSEADSQWYNTVGQMIRKIAHNDEHAREVLVRVFAYFSQAGSVPSNTLFALKAAHEVMKGNYEPNTGRFPKRINELFKAVMGEKVFSAALKGVGPKLEAFYRNIMDGATGKKEYPGSSTIDRHMIRLIWPDKAGEDSTLTPAQNLFAQKLMQEVTRRVNVKRKNKGQDLLLPSELQGMLWGYQLNKAKKEKSKAWNYPEYLDNATFRVLAEVIPTTKTEDGVILSTMPEDWKQDFHRAAMALIMDGSRNKVLDLLKEAPFYEVTEGTGGYEGQTSPVGVTAITSQRVAGRNDEGRKTDQYDASTVRAYARAVQYIFRQDAVPFFRPDYLSPKKAAQAEGRNSGLIIRTNRDITGAEESALFASLMEQFGVFDAGYTKMGPREIAVVNFHGEKDKAFFDKLDIALQNAFEDGIVDDAHTRQFTSEGDYLTHDWQADPNGQEILNETGLAGRSDLPLRLAGWRSQFDQLARQWAEGWSKDQKPEFTEEFSTEPVEQGDRGEREAPVLPVRGSGAVRLVHYSNVGNLNRLDPAKHGAGLSGAESKRKKASPDNWVDRTYFGVVDGPAAYKKEPGLGPHAYNVDVDATQLYDFQNDPAGLLAKSLDFGRPDLTLYEKNIRDAGYEGFWTNNEQLGMVVAKFTPTQTEAFAEEAMYGELADAVDFAVGEKEIAKEDAKWRETHEQAKQKMAQRELVNKVIVVSKKLPAYFEKLGPSFMSYGIVAGPQAIFKKGGRHTSPEVPDANAKDIALGLFKPAMVIEAQNGNKGILVITTSLGTDKNGKENTPMAIAINTEIPVRNMAGDLVKSNFIASTFLMDKTNVANHINKMIEGGNVLWMDAEAVDLELDDALYGRDNDKVRLKSGDVAADETGFVRQMNPELAGPKEGRDYDTPDADFSLDDEGALKDRLYDQGYKVQQDGEILNANGTRVGNINNMSPIQKYRLLFVPKVLDRIDRAINGMGQLEDSMLYMNIRRLTLGTLDELEQYTRNIYKTLRKATKEEAEAIHTFFTTKSADPSTLPAQYRDEVVKIKNNIIETGRKLVDRGLLPKEALIVHEDSYLPRLYMKHMLGDDASSITGSGKGAALWWQKKRKNIDENVRMFILGQVKDPAFLAAISQGVQMRDLVLFDMFKEIAKNPKWVLPRSFIEWTHNRDIVRTHGNVEYTQNPDGTFDLVVAKTNNKTVTHNVTSAELDGLVGKQAAQNMRLGRGRPTTEKVDGQWRMSEYRGLGKVEYRKLKNGTYNVRVKEKVTSHKTLSGVAETDLTKHVSKSQADAIKEGKGKLKDGVMMTPYHMMAEAQRLRDMADVMPEEDAAKTRAYAESMDAAARAAIRQINETHSINVEANELPENFRQVPNTARYGTLRGMIVRKEIYDDLIGNITFKLGERSTLETILGEGGFLSRVHGFWKWTHTAMNPTTHARNWASNTMLVHLSGVPMHRIPGLYVKALRQIIAYHKNEKSGNGNPNDFRHYSVALRYGLGKSTFTAQELNSIETEFLDLLARTDGKVGWKDLRLLYHKVVRVTGNAYQFGEAVGKTVILIHRMDRGMSEDMAAGQAHKWLFDYSHAAPSVRYARSVPLGAPFLTFALKVLPRMMEVAMTAPWRFAPYIVLMQALPLLFAQMNDVDDDDYEELMEAAPKMITDRSHTYILPYKDDNGKWQILDLGYLFPWTQWIDTAKGVAELDLAKTIAPFAMGGPIPDLIRATGSGVDPFTKRSIIPKDAYWGHEKAGAMLGYLYNMFAPPYFGRYSPWVKSWQAAQGTVDRYGQPRTTSMQAALRFVGVNVYSFDPKISRYLNAAAMQYELDDLIWAGSRVAADPNLTEDQRQKAQADLKEKADHKANQIREYLEGSDFNQKLNVNE